MIMVSITGDVWQPNMTRKQGPNENTTHYDRPDILKMTEDYEGRHGACSSFTIKVVK